MLLAYCSIFVTADCTINKNSSKILKNFKIISELCMNFVSEKKKQKFNVVKSLNMKKIFVIIFSVFLLGVMTAEADNDRVITKNELPVKAQQFVNAHFPTSKISYVKEERDFFDRNYEIVFADGAKVEFSRIGEWIDVDCRYSSVPQAIIPDAIKAYVKEYFPDALIIEIERKRGNHEVKLSNKLELIFDKKLRIKDVDD